MISHDFPGFPFPGGETTWALGNFFGSHMASIAPMAAVALWEEDSWGEEAKIAKELQGLALWAYACKWDFKALAGVDMGVSENSVPHLPNGFADHYPY
jgi:hypothetical protein